MAEREVQKQLVTPSLSKHSKEERGRTSENIVYLVLHEISTFQFEDDQFLRLFICYSFLGMHLSVVALQKYHVP